MKLLDEFNIQLYSVRDAMEGNYLGVLEKLGRKGMGYTGVEFAGYGGLPADEMKRVLAENGLKPVSGHTDADSMIADPDKDLDYLKAVGAEYVICSWSEIRTKEDTLELARKLTPVAEKIKSSGLKFAYHNHDFEFIKEDGEYLLDILFDNLPAGTVMELDIFWSEYAGVDSMAYMEKHKDRLEILHVKQIDKDKNNVDLDKGLIDFQNVISYAKSLGVKHFVFEQERYEVSSMVSAENAVRYIDSL